MNIADTEAIICGYFNFFIIIIFFNLTIAIEGDLRSIRYQFFSCVFLSDWCVLCSFLIVQLSTMSIRLHVRCLTFDIK